MRRREVSVLPEGLRAWRQQRQWSQKELAERTEGNVSATLIAMIETGERQPSRLNAEDIARALGVPLRAFAIVHGDTGVVDAAAEVVA